LHGYKNEIMIALAALELAGSMMFRASNQAQLESRSSSVESLAGKIEDISILQKLWKKNKSIPQGMKTIQNSLVASKVKKFKVDKKKAHIVLEELTAKELNSITGKSLASMAVQITELSIVRNDKSYRLELKCKW